MQVTMWQSATRQSPEPTPPPPRSAVAASRPISRSVGEGNFGHWALEILWSLVIGHFRKLRFVRSIPRPPPPVPSRMQIESSSPPRPAVGLFPRIEYSSPHF